MKRKNFLVVAISITAILLFSVSTFAMSGGMPAKHGVDGDDFGAAVSGLAQTNPAALAEHVSDMKGGLDEEPEETMAGGMPAKHGVDGKTFGGLVSDLARTAPGAVAEHVANKPEAEMPENPEIPEEGGGMPEAHGLTGQEFGAAVSNLAQENPAALAKHAGGRKP